MTGAVSVASGCQTDAGRWSYVCVVIIAAFTAHCLAALLMRRKKLTGLQFVMFLVCFLAVDSMQIILVELYLMAGQVKRYLGQKRSDDLIISASPFCIIEPITKRFGFQFVATECDREYDVFLNNVMMAKEKAKQSSTRHTAGPLRREGASGDG